MQCSIDDLCQRAARRKKVNEDGSQLGFVMGTSVPRTHFSTSEMPEVDQFDAWRDKISVIFDVARIGSPRSTSFEARVDAYQIGSLVITDSMQGEQAYVNTPKRIRCTGVDLFQVGFYRSGGYSGDANGQSIEGKPGDVQVLDLAQPISSVEPASDMVCVFVPREILQQRIGDLDGLHGVHLGPGVSGLLGDYLVLLAERLPFMSEDDGGAAANATLDMISACLRPTTKRLHEAQSSMRQVTLHRAMQVIEANLRSPRLTPDFICRALCVPRRSLYRLFEPLGGIHSYILHQRLARVMRTIKESRNHSRLADVAASYGFYCQETFWRTFKRHYRMTPGDVRLLYSSSEELAARHAEGGFDDWLKRLGP